MNLESLRPLYDQPGDGVSVFHAGQASAADPKYTVVPQRQRRDAAGPAAAEPDPAKRIA